MNAYVWTLEEAVVFLREVQALVEPLGYHTGLLGSVVLKGKSKNDLDIVIYPASTAQQSIVNVVVALVGMGMVQTFTRDQVRKAW